MGQASLLTIKEVSGKLGWPVWKARKWIWKLDLKPVEYRPEERETEKGLRRYLVAYYSADVIKRIENTR